MPRKRVEAALLDTNVLLDATDTRRARHRAVLDLFERRSGLVLSAQVAREYLVVCTRSVDLNGLGLELPDAIANLAEFRRIARLLPEERPLLPTLLKLLQAVPCQGNTVHDALLVATMRVHKIAVLVTSNPKHFRRFGDLLTLVEPG